MPVPHSFFPCSSVAYGAPSFNKAECSQVALCPLESVEGRGKTGSSVSVDVVEGPGEEVTKSSSLRLAFVKECTSAPGLTGSSLAGKGTEERLRCSRVWGPSWRTLDESGNLVLPRLFHKTPTPPPHTRGSPELPPQAGIPWETLLNHHPPPCASQWLPLWLSW